jgi:hypothetical protein
VTRCTAGVDHGIARNPSGSLASVDDSFVGYTGNGESGLSPVRRSIRPIDLPDLRT